MVKHMTTNQANKAVPDLYSLADLTADPIRQQALEHAQQHVER